MAMSVPAPIAIPTSAAARAGESLMPSPTMATTLPSFWKERTASAFPAGITSALTSSMPTCITQRQKFTSADATRVRKSPRSIPVKVLAVVTVAFPCLTFCALSKASPPFMRTPLAAPTPVATMTAVGVASPSAHGHAITTTAMENMREKTKQLLPSESHVVGTLIKTQTLAQNQQNHKAQDLEKAHLQKIRIEHHVGLVLQQRDGDPSNSLDATDSRLNRTSARRTRHSRNPKLNLPHALPVFLSSA
ncbi:hypothetical protein IEQ34_015697 [Dendrobium chrysotoxum]|uniref:Uncharacterized protein n=1 Tax=Dendrobium chrysotoxum TaxID=161865 RepID=A0AAV7GHE0_DENCH|nr:hypothetical protein IEQ34_015697 [Dendrobium chrysotoxum]